MPFARLIVSVIVMILWLTFSATLTAVAFADDLPKNDFEERKVNQSRCEEELAVQLTQLKKCDTLRYSDTKTAVYCMLSYNGLKLEFAAINITEFDPTVYVYSLGNDQVLSNFGRNCISIRFKDDENTKKCNISAPELIFHGRGAIVGRYGKLKARLDCE
jgi:hypothetical protein